MDIETQETSSTTPITTEPSDTGIEKFKSGADRDKAYLELEKMNSDQARRLADLESKLDAIVTAPSPAPQRQFTDVYPSQKSDTDRETELASRLLTRPSEVLRQIREETMNEVRQHLTHERLVAKFQREHPDLVKHEEIVAMFVRKQPDNLSAEQRLRLAVPEARKYLATIASSNSQQTTTLDPAAYVESPTQRPAPVTAPSEEASQEDELTAHLKERAATQAKKMRV